MSFKDLEPGSYKAWIADWGLTEVDLPSGPAMKAFIQMDIMPSEGEPLVKGRFDCFVLTKDGNANKKLLRTMLTCGFQGDSIEEFTHPMALDNKKEYEVTVIEENGYKKIEWINDPSQARVQKVTDVKKLKGFDLKSAFKQAREDAGVVKGQARSAVPNVAPDMIKKASGDSEELGF